MKIMFLCLSLLCASDITLEFIQTKPRGIARDFYIWRFLQDPKTSLQEAIVAYDLVYKKNPKIEKLIAQKGYIHELPKEVGCKQMDFKKLQESDGECIAFGLKLSNIPSLPISQTQAMIQKLQEVDPIIAQEVKILTLKDPLPAILATQNAKIFSEIFYGLNLAQRQAIFNHNIPANELAIIANQNDPNFNKMLQYVLLSHQFNEFKKSILQAPIQKVEDKILLLIGIAQAQANHLQKAQEYFSLILETSKNQLFRDKALFWQYLISQDKNYLQTLAQSPIVNLYSIYAAQTLKVKPAYTIISKLDDLKNVPPSFDITNPFEWQILRDSLIKIPTGDELKPILDQKLAHPQSSPHYAYMLNRIKKYKGNYFLMPYDSLLNWKSNHQKALTYAIAKQESNLLPALISSSYALGMMQIMPFNLEPFAKAMGKKDANLDDLFHPQNALEYGRFYLAELENEFKHPLFVAYAYNGGPGFWRRTLEKKTLFIKNRKYEPWLSLELIPYEESKNYGQIVLANYIIYQQILGKEINLQSFLNQTLVN
ncbi:lytic transglycosylase domain-containing protein [Helicobacter cholecystus]|uniref:lytic transglycosylase domain-containing protein n=1 Tax=Helicobacter cholecystus TaxID=45498 RepID=UPI001E578A15|nr:lytic transglycosylase domain-containing protein [Helicobacter cholecystus]